MNETLEENPHPISDATSKPRRRHPYTMSNTTEETIRRMNALPKRIAELYERLEKLNGDRAEDSR